MERLAYLGPHGTFTEEAARKFLSSQEVNENVELLPYPNIRTLLLAIDDHKEEQGILPIENSLEGSVNIALDLLAHEVNLKIKSEVMIPINHNLIGQPGAKLTKINKVLSHSQALAQCRNNLTQFLGEFETLSTSSTAEAVCIIKDKSSNWAAIASKLVAELNDLEILASNIQDNESNWTRFIVVRHEDSPKLDEAKTSLILSPIQDRPGILYEILKEFAIRNINLTRIESRPARKMLGDYIFFIDFEGHRQEEVVAEMLKELEPKTSSLKIIGSYPQFKKK
jgi:prephenate dehydratase